MYQHSGEICIITMSYDLCRALYSSAVSARSLDDGKDGGKDASMSKVAFLHACYF
jgi:hypothetical protein